MTANRKLKSLMIAAILLFLLLALLTLTWMTGAFIDLWQQLELLPGWVKALYLLVITLVIGLFAGLLWWLLRPSANALKSDSRRDSKTVDQLEGRIELARSEDIDTASVEGELQELKRRREAGVIHIAVFGEISSGKSSLIRALLSDADIVSSATGGTTRELSEYHWKSSAGDTLVLVDMPGLNEADGTLGSIAREEAQRSHIVIFVTDSDLTRTEYAAIKALLQFSKPMIIAINKADWYEDAAIVQLKAAIKSELPIDAEVEIVSVQAGGDAFVTRILPDGSEEQVSRAMPADITALSTALQRVIDTNRDVLDGLRDAAVFVLADRKLDTVLAEERGQRSKRLVADYSKKAVVAAMASVTPGSDLIIQGVLATRMIRELSALYGVPVRDVDTGLLIELVQKHVGTVTTLALAVAGNALKAFPGIGTVTGGVLHAIAYGMIFNTLGHAVAGSLASRGELRPLVVSSLFRDSFESEMSESVSSYARVAMNYLRGRE